MATERTPLLAKDDADPQLDTTTVLHEMKVLVGYALPTTATALIRYCGMATGIIFVSHLGTTALAGANLGLVTANVFGVAPVIGLISALDTLSNQASRSASPKLACLYAWRTFVVCCFGMPIIFLILFNCRSIFRIIMPNADQDMITMASSYCKIISLGLPSIAGFECVRRYLAAFGLVTGPAYANILAFPLIVTCNYVFVQGPWDPLRVGFIGAPLAVVLANNAIFLVIIIYALVAAPKHTLVPPSRAIFQDLYLNWKYGILGIASVCTEWLAFEYCSIAAGYLGIEAQAINSIFACVTGGFYQLPYALSVAAAIRVGNLLGENRPLKAKKAVRVAQSLALGEVLFTAVLMFVFRRKIVGVFSDDAGVMYRAEHDIWVLLVTLMGDGMQGVNTGIMKGMGMPSLAARLNVVSYWMIGLPIGTALCYWKTQNLVSIWFGLAVSVTLVSTSMTHAIYRNDFSERAKEAAERNAVSDEHAHLTLHPDEEAPSFEG